MSLPPGCRLGPYEILAPLGGGGMGEVFKARDTRLDRVVAVKTLRPEIALDPDRRARFEREARLIASINHPHICTLYDVGRDRVFAGDRAGEEEVEFLVMELLEGETLARRLSRGPLSLTDTLIVAIQIAGALDCAHRQGIVHRDLKPANIMLTRSGAKLLDFGVARFRSAQEPPVDAATRTAMMTTQGAIVGTLQYMAPEQLEGREVDGRADLFAFGAVIYEMATGHTAFQASSSAGVINAVLNAQPPPITTVDPRLPRALERVVAGCLARQPDERWSSAHDLALMLKAIADDTTAEPPAVAARSRRREWLAWAVAAFALVAAGTLAFRPAPAAGIASADVLALLPPVGVSLTPGEAPQVSPDGRHIAFVGTDRTGRTLLYVRERDSLAAKGLQGTDDVSMAFWSPDSRSIGFFAGGKLKRIEQSGGPAQTLAAVSIPRGGAWSRDGLILFVPYPNSAPLRIPATGGTATPVPVPFVSGRAPQGRWFPRFLPDGRHYVYLSVDMKSRQTALRVGSLDSPESKDLVASEGAPVYASEGYLVFRRETSLVAQRFDATRLELTGTPMTIVDNVGIHPGTAQTLVSVSDDGVLAYFEAMPAAQLVWFDRLGRRLGPATAPSAYNSLCFRVDGRKVVYDAADSVWGIDLWSLELPSGSPQRLTFDRAVDFYVACAPSGDDIVFASLRDGIPTVYRQNTTAPGSERLVAKLDVPALPNDWSHDGRWIVLSTYSPKTKWDIWVLPLAGGSPVVYAATEANERSGRLSPDGRWMAYASDEGGASEVYVQPFPATGAKWQVSRDGGGQPIWGAGGKELFHISRDRKIVVVEVNSSGPAFTSGPSRVLDQTRVLGWDRTNQNSPYAVTPDGERLLVGTAVDTPLPITVVLNWPSILARK